MAKFISANTPPPIQGQNPPGQSGASPTKKPINWNKLIYTILTKSYGWIVVVIILVGIRTFGTWFIGGGH